MGILERSDGTRVRGLPLLRGFLPFVMPGRNESAVFFEQKLRVEGTLTYLSTRLERGLPKVSFFHVVLAAVARVLEERPKLHRFVVGRRTYARRHLEMSFAVKKSMADEAVMTTVKVRFPAGVALSDIPGLVDRAIAEGRGQSMTTSEREMSVVGLLPRFLVRFVMWAQRVLDYWGLLPAAMIRNDPLYASVFLANLGSIGVDAPFHHLYEYGTVPIFVAIGRIHDEPVVTREGMLAVGRVVTLRYTFDERIADGYYCARSLERFQRYIEEPELLEQPLSD